MARTVTRTADPIGSGASPEGRYSGPRGPEFERLLWYDVCAEYDARLYSRYLHSLDVDFSPEFWQLERAWAEDEACHFESLKAAFARFFDWTERHDAQLAARRADFGPLEHLFTDEFAVLCLGAYDELVTVRGYRTNFHVYGEIDPQVEGLVRRITADEGLHYKAFLDLLRRHHGHRFDEAPRQLARIRAAEGKPYAATFVFDHDDPVYEDWIFDEALALLARRLKRREEGRAPQPGRA